VTTQTQPIRVPFGAIAALAQALTLPNEPQRITEEHVRDVLGGDLFIAEARAIRAALEFFDNPYRPTA
jgi:hypothetical protein